MNHKSHQPGNLQLPEINHVNLHNATQFALMAKTAVETLPAAVLLVCLIAGVFAFFR